MANKSKNTKKTKDEIEETNEVEEMEEEEDFLEEKKSKKSSKKDKDEKSTFSKIMNVILWIVLFAWMAVCLIDFYNVHNENDPVMCIKKGTTEYDDGTVDWCLGVGYKVYRYDRDSFKAIEFGPFWSKDRSAEEEN